MATTNKKSKADPCWDGYEKIGMKEKGGKLVPNCVPIKKGNKKAATKKTATKKAVGKKSAVKKASPKKSTPKS